MSKITLNNVNDLTQTTTAQSTINGNNSVIQTAFDNTLSRDGTVPNQMTSQIDMNSNRIINLPSALSNSEPVILSTLNAAILGKGNVPAGGTTGMVLAKNSNTDFDTKWESESSAIVAGANITVTGTSPATISTTASPTFSGVNVSSLTASTAVAADASKNLVSVTNTGTGNNVLSTSPTLVTPTLGVATATSIVFNPTTGGIIGTTTNDSAPSGTVGEYLASTITSGSSVAVTTGSPTTVTNITLTAGDWDVDCVCSFLPANTTSVTQFVTSLSTTTNALDTTVGKLGIHTSGATVYNGTTQAQVSLPPYRFSVATNTTVFLIAQSTFTVSTNAAFGIIRARRVR